MSRRNSKELQVEALLAAYEDIEVIGKGSFGLIRKVRRRADGKIFARKELDYHRMADRDRKQIVAEVNILRQLNHQNIVRYVERINDAKASCLHVVMEYCQNGDLGTVIKNCRRESKFLKEDVVWSYLAQMTRALAACHNGMPVSPEAGGQGITLPLLHRDLKPENVFLDAQNNVKLGDFGLSKQIGAAHAFASTYVGTPYYMSPELATGGSYDAKSDIWALGCIVYELCALRPPFDATSQAELTVKIKSGQVPSLPRRYSAGLEEVVRSMLQLQPRKRPNTSDLLDHPRVLFATQTIDLRAVREAVSAEQEHLRVEKLRLAQWEDALSHRQSELDNRSEAEAQAPSAEQLAQEANQLKHDRETFESQAACAAVEWARRVSELAEAESKLAGERAEFEQIKAAWHDSRGKEAQVPLPQANRPPRTFDSAALRRLGESTGSKPSPGRKSSRPSMGYRRTSASGDVSMEGASSRAVKLTVTGRLSDARKRRSSAPQTAGDDGWYDAQGESGNEAPEDDHAGVVTATEPFSPAKAVSDRDLPTDYARTSQRPIGRQDAADVRQVKKNPAGGLARFLNRERTVPAADRSDVSMRDITPVDADKENEVSQATSPSVFTKSVRRGSIVQRARRIPLDHQRAANGTSSSEEQEAMLATTERNHANEAEEIPVEASKEASPRARDATPGQSSMLRAERAISDPMRKFDPESPPIYDVSNDFDLPSPFLRKPAKSLPPSALIKSRSSAALNAPNSESNSAAFMLKVAAVRSAQKLSRPSVTSDPPGTTAPRPSLTKAGTASLATGNSAASRGVLKDRRSTFAAAGLPSTGRAARTRPSAPSACESVPGSTTVGVSSLARRPRPANLANGGHEPSSSSSAARSGTSPFIPGQGVSLRRKSYVSFRTAATAAGAAQA